MNTNIKDILLAPWKTGVLVTAIRLNVFTIISDQALGVEEIASRSFAKPDLLQPLLNACVRLGFLDLKDNKYNNTHFSLVYFMEGKRLYVGDFLKVVDNESVEWFQLPDMIQGKEKKEMNLPGLEFDYKTFITAMNSIGQMGEAEALKNAVDLTGCKHLIDAGGGSGLYSIALCQKYPELRTTILDVKETLAVTRELIEGYPEKERITLREGNFFEDPLGKDLDTVLLSDVLYREEDAGILLKNAWKSLAPNGSLIVRGYYADSERSGPLLGALFAVKLIVSDPTKKCMTVSMLENNVKKAGFKNIGVKPLTDLSFVLIGTK